MPKTRTEKMDSLYRRSGEIVTDDKLVAFLYELMRDKVTPGEIEELMQKGSYEDTGEASYCLTNGYLAGYAADVAIRLRAK